jgi:DGQHR domain-containing protein
MELTVKATRYRQGGERDMISTVLTPRALANMAHFPEEWNPLGDPRHGNRLTDKKHVEAIDEYLDTVKVKVLNSLLAYGSPKEFRFEADDPDGAGPIQFGTLHATVGARLDMGDGNHRGKAIVRHLKHLTEEGAEDMLAEFDEFGIPVNIVLDPDPIRRAQDFVDLQRNVKPLTSSIAYSMDRRNPTSKALLDLVQRDDLPIFRAGDRVEFHRDNPGKLSPKIASFKTVRYASGTLLIGASQRSTRGWESAVASVLKERGDEAVAGMVAFWNGLSTAEPFARVIDGSLSVPEVRQATYMLSAGVLYACAYAVHMAHKEDALAVGEAAQGLARVDCSRPDREPSEDKPYTTEETIFAGTLIDPETGKVSAGRNAWESAAEDLRRVIVS